MNFEKLTRQLNIDSQEFIFQFQSHPNYPSALAFSDTLNFLGFKNDAYELEKEYWNELPEEFVAIYHNDFALIKKEGNKARIFSNEEKETTFGDVVQNSQEFVLLFERSSERKHAKKESNSHWVLLALGFLLLLVSGYFQQWWFLVYNALTVVGIYIFFEIFKEKFGNTSVMVNNFCGGGKVSAQTEDDCQKIFRSKDFQFLGLNFSDVGLVYFLTVGLLGFILSGNSLVFKAFSGLASLAILYSVYYQTKTKAFCKICALVIGILILQLIVVFQIDSSAIIIEYQFRDLLIALSMLIIGFAAVYFFSKNVAEKEALRKEHTKNLRFKRNYELFKSQLLAKEKIDFEKQHEVFFFGEKNSPLQISLVSNPYCGFCKDAHSMVEKIREQHPEISLQLRFNYDPKMADEKYTSLMSHFVSLDKNKNETELMEALDFWFEKRNEIQLKEKFNLKDENEDIEQVIKMAEENKLNGFNFTPIIIINGYQFPDAYDRDDLFYFIDDLLEDEDVIR